MSRSDEYTVQQGCWPECANAIPGTDWPERAPDALVAPPSALDSLMLTALPLLMRDILREAEAFITDKEVVGEGICLVRRQKALRLIEDELPRECVINLCCGRLDLFVRQEIGIFLLPRVAKRIVGWRTFVQ